MSTELTETNQASSRKVISYVPLGQTSEIIISREILTKHVIAPTKSGRLPSDHDMTAFIALCRAQRLNPFTKDCYLLGYDGRDGATFSIITAKSALDKRAESNEHFDGYESGLVLSNNDGSIEFRQGAICRPGERSRVVGAWCNVFRKDRGRPVAHEVNRDVYDTGKSRWAIDLPGMLIKCAEAGALRKAFPNLFAGLYIEEELEPEKMAKGEVTSSTEQPEPAQRSALPPRKKNLSVPNRTSETTTTTDPAPLPKAEARESDALVDLLVRSGIPAEKIIPTLNAMGIYVDDVSELERSTIDHLRDDIDVVVETYKLDVA